MNKSTNSPLISIIIPAYNAANFIETSISSAQRQTYDNVEIIIVNDGSKDATESKCRSMQAFDSRIKLYTIPNGGASNARSFGVKQARGEYITFLDADDSLKEDALDTLFSAMNQDISIVVTSDLDEIISSDSFRIQILTQKIISAPWGKLFRKELFNSFVFDMPKELIRGEDFIMNLRLAYNDNLKVANIAKNIYSYTPQEFSITRTFKFCRQHELLFYKELRRSFPDFKKYISYILKLRLYTYKNMVWFKIYDKEEQYYLLNEFNLSHVRLSLIDLIILKTTNHFLCRQFVFMDKLYNRLFNKR